MSRTGRSADPQMTNRPTTVGEVDDAVQDWVLSHRNGALTEVMVNASRLGSTPVLLVVALVVAAWLAWRGRRGDSLLVLVGSAGALAMWPILKVIIERPRPDVRDHLVLVDSWSFPSGHSLNSMAVIGLLTVLAMRERPGRVRRTLIATLGALLVLVIGYSRVYLGVHWPSDVLAGWLLAVAWLTLCFTLMSGNRRRSGTVRSGS